MADDTPTIKVGDTRTWQTTLTSAGDDDLTDVASAVVYMRHKNGTTNKIDGSAAVVGATTATSAILTYSPTAANVDTAGEYNITWKVTFTTGSLVAAFPSKGFNRLNIEANIE